DQSTSMNTVLPGSTQTRWQAVTTAIINFLNTSQSTALSVGIQYFGQPAVGGTPGASTCDIAAYSTADVELGSLSDPNQVTALTQSIQRHMPSTFTPTGPALAGAIAHAKTWASSHPDHPTIVVLATDGFPSECDPMDLTTIATTIVGPAASAPADSAANARIRTFVIAAGNDSGLGGLQAISSAGGTGSPFVVMDNANSGAQITAALVQISHTNLACTYVIPVPDAGLDPSLVNVRLTASGQAPVLLDLLKPGQLCTAAGGFFYDSPTAPKHISLCPATCDSLVTGSLEIVVGCPTRGPQ
ncbi:MAG TPA: vWA domain-containing protein, partial [Polyangiaceae bacterium]